METRKLAAILFAGRVLAAGTLMALLAVNEGALAQDPEPMPPSPPVLHEGDDTGIRDGVYTQKNNVRLVNILAVEPDAIVSLMSGGGTVIDVTAVDEKGYYQLVAGSLKFNYPFDYRVKFEYAGGRTAFSRFAQIIPWNILPSVGSVYPIDPLDPGGPVNYQSAMETLGIAWEGFGVETGSGIVRYWVTVGAQPPTELEVPVFGTGSGTHMITGLTLGHGIKYCVTLVGEDAAGLKNGLITTGVIVDTTNPVIGDVRDGDLTDAGGNYIDVNEWPLTMAFNATFSPGTDPESGVTQYEIALGTTSPGGADVVDFTKCSVSLRKGRYIVALGGLDLQKNVTYYTTIRAKNGAGSYTDATSDGFKVK